MELFDNDINKKIVAGFFPSEKIYPATKPSVEFDIEAKALPGLKLFSENTELFDLLLFYSYKAVEQIDTLKNKNYYKASFNCMINANCTEEYLNPNGSFIVASNMIPVVTKMDKALWYAARSAFIETKLGINKKEYDPSEMFFTWLYLLLVTQKQELSKRKTININSHTQGISFLNVLLAEYDESPDCQIFSNLKQEEISELTSLYEKRRQLIAIIFEERTHSKKIAKSTKKEWEAFINILNDLSSNEARVVKEINKSITRKEKIKAIKQYNKLISCLTNGKYYLNGKWISMLKLVNAIDERTKCSFTCTCVKTSEGEAFTIHPAIFQLVLTSHTYNYIFILFHLFRLEPTLENASEFFTLALEYINKNLNRPTAPSSSIDEIINQFHISVKEYMDSIRPYLNNISFSKLLPDAAVVENSSMSYITTQDIYIKKISERNNTIIEKDKTGDEIIKLLECTTNAGSMKQLIAYEEAEQEQIEFESKARNIVYSLNIIYLFCDAIRIILINSDSMICNQTAAERCRKELRKIDDELVHKVYVHMDENEIDMHEYREKSGIIHSSLSDIEVQAENMRNSAFSDTFKSIINEMISHLEEQDSDGILQIKKRIKEELSIFPDCDEKRAYADWLDSISERLSGVLIQNCQENKQDFLEVKNQICSSLGKKCVLLPLSSIDSLTTAEMLYTRYANPDYSKDGFDYSCISALYYQAFEDAYNELIWSKYASYLNSLVCSGMKYTDILKKHNNFKNEIITETDAQGFLFDNKLKKRSHYLDYTVNNQVSVNSRCMYQSFVFIMKEIRNSTSLIGFCDFFAKLTGYSGISDMFNDVDFMQKCHEFTDQIDCSVVNRNNASHGGSFISLTQCENDKKTVLHDLETVRRECVGLVQQLLYILQQE